MPAACKTGGHHGSGQLNTRNTASKRVRLWIRLRLMPEAIEWLENCTCTRIRCCIVPRKSELRRNQTEAVGSVPPSQLAMAATATTADSICLGHRAPVHQSWWGGWRTASLREGPCSWLDIRYSYPIARRAGSPRGVVRPLAGLKTAFV